MVVVAGATPACRIRSIYCLVVSGRKVIGGVDNTTPLRTGHYSAGPTDEVELTATIVHFTFSDAHLLGSDLNSIRGVDALNPRLSSRSTSQITNF